MTRSEIIARAESAIGLRYTWGSESWIPNAGTGQGTDCSGLTLKCWEAPRTMLYQEEDGVNASISPRYTSYDFYNCQGPWSALSSRSSLREGDILVCNDGDSGHVVIYAGGDAWNSPIIYEAPGSNLTIRRTSRYLGSEYLPRRRIAILETSAIILDNPTAKSIGGSDLNGNWTRSTSNSGYYGDNYQTQAATTATAWARWTPRFSSGGYYNVYLRWTSGSNRASSAKVHYQHGRRTVHQVRQSAGERRHLVLARPVSLRRRVCDRSRERHALGYWGQRLRRSRRGEICRYAIASASFRVPASGADGRGRARPAAGPARYLRAHLQGERSLATS